MKSRPYTHQRCPICCAERDFKYLPQEHDEHGRTLMVCTTCNCKRARPGQAKAGDRVDIAGSAGLAWGRHGKVRGMDDSARLVRLKQTHVTLLIEALTDLGTPAAAAATKVLRKGPMTVGRFRLNPKHLAAMREALEGRPPSPLLKATTKRLGASIALQPVRPGAQPEDRQHKLSNEAAAGGERKRARHITGGPKGEH